MALTKAHNRMIAGSIVNVVDYGATGDGVTDDAPAIQAAINAADGSVFFPAGTYNCLSAITIQTGTYLIGEGSAASGSTANLSILSHNFDGDFITFNGAAGSNSGDGGGLKDLNIIQAKTTGSATDSAVKLTGTTTSSRANWIRIINCQIEENTGAVKWQYGVNADGSSVGGTDGIRDIWISNTRFVAGTAAIRLFNVFNVWLSDIACNLTGSDIVIDGTSGNVSSSVFLTNVTGVNLTLDHAEFVMAAGGSFTAVSTTANTDTCNLNIGYLGTIPNPLLGTKVFLATNDPNVSGSMVSVSSEMTAHAFGRDTGAGDSTNTTQVTVGNLGSNEGSIALRYVNAAASGGPTTGLYPFIRNNADSSNFGAGSLRWEKIPGSDLANTILQNSASDYVQIDAANSMIRSFLNSVEAFRIDETSTAGETRMLVYDVDNATLERVSVGSADSGGAGYKVLRIPN